jgi:hypothetical protein
MGRRKAEEERSMDSLMDALTNVVGILLLILIISSLGMSAAIKVIVENLPEVSKEQLEQMKTIVDEQRKQMAQLKDTSTLQEESTKDRDKLQAQVALRIKDLEDNNKELQDKVNDLAELEKRLKEQKEAKVVNDEEVLVASSELADLRAILEQTPEREIKEADVVRMPNPRLSMAETHANYVVCRGKKVYFIGNPYDHTFIIRDLLDREAAKLAYRGDAIGSYVSVIPGPKLNDRKTGFNPLTESMRKDSRFVKDVPFANLSLTEWNTTYDKVTEGPVIQKVFYNKDKRDMPVYEYRLDPAKVATLFGDGVPAPEPYDGLIYIVTRNGTSDRLVMKFGFNPERGWTRDQFRQRGSTLDIAFKGLSLKSNELVYFHVSSDSFRTYLSARDMADFYKIPAGWATFRGETMQLKATAKIKTARINLVLPVQDYVQLASKVGAIMAQNTRNEIQNFTGNLAAIKAPAEIEKNPAEKAKWLARLKGERQAFIRTGLQVWTRQLFEAALVSNEVRGVKEVGIDVHPPEIPHSRLFLPRSLPKAPRPVADPNKPKPPSKPKKPTDTTKLILD